MGGGYSAELVPSLKGKVAIITGANTGIGKVTALVLAKRECHVFLACRSKERTMPVVEEIKKASKNDKVDFIELNLASLKSVSKCAKTFKKKNLPLHLLINNAGIMACPFAKTEDGIESQFGTNHLGHFHLTVSLLDLIKSSAPARIVNLTSEGHKLSYKEGILFDSINDEKKI